MAHRFGGDHGVPIPVMGALEAIGETITLVQVDAHLDWRDNVNVVREGYSSPIRRVTEMKHIGDIYQLGIRSSGSARAEGVDADRAYGSNIVMAYDIHDYGMAAVLDRIPDGGHYYLTIDLNGLDPSIAPAVVARTPGGLLYHHMRTLIRGVVGMDLIEIAPKHDLGGVTCGGAGRMVMMYIGAAVRAGYFD
jgi:agmatinase